MVKLEKALVVGQTELEAKEALEKKAESSASEAGTFAILCFLLFVSSLVMLGTTLMYHGRWSRAKHSDLMQRLDNEKLEKNLLECETKSRW